MKWATRYRGDTPYGCKFFAICAIMPRMNSQHNIKPYGVIIPTNLADQPKNHEVSAAMLLSEYFKANVVFIPSSPDRRTPDFRIENLYWELKSPTGKSETNIEHQLKHAQKQSENVILDLRASKIHETKAINAAKYQLKLLPRIKRLLVIRKNNQIIVLK